MVFHAQGVVTINRREAADVLLSFSAAGNRAFRSARGRTSLPTSAPAPVRTDKLGRWAQDGFSEGVVYQVMALAPGVTFPPVTIDVDHREIRSAGIASTFSASGVARSAAAFPVPATQIPQKPPGIAGVQVVFVRLAGRADVPVPPPVLTGTDGTWQQQGFQVGGTFSAVPSKAGLDFAPAAVDITPAASSEFTGSANVFAVSGRVVTAGGAPEPGVTIAFSRLSGSGPVPAAVATDATGHFQQAGFAQSTVYRVTPGKNPQSFDPTSRDIAFAPNTFRTVSAVFERRTNLVVVGQVLTTAGAGLLSTVIRFERLAGDGAVPLPITTSSNGEFRTAGLDAGSTYRVTGTRDGFGVTPAVLQASSPGTVTLNLTAYPAFDVVGRVLSVEGFPAPALDGLAAFLDALPPIPGAVVAFHRTDGGTASPEPVVADSDGTFRQRGFELGGAYIAQASEAGFVGATLIDFGTAVIAGLGLGGFFGGTVTGAEPTSDGGSTTFTHAAADPLSGLLLLLQRA